MPQTTQEHNSRLLAAHTRRLQVLELKKAELGIDTPPEVETEIEKINREMVKITATVEAITVLDALTPPQGVQIDRRVEGDAQRTRTMIATVQPIVGSIAEQTQAITGEINYIRDDVQALEASTRREVIEIRREVKQDLKDARKELNNTAKSIENLVMSEIRDVRRLMRLLTIGIVLWEIITRGIEIAIAIANAVNG